VHQQIDQNIISKQKKINKCFIGVQILESIRKSLDDDFRKLIGRQTFVLSYVISFLLRKFFENSR
jgi:hypothetical protein